MAECLDPEEDADLLAGLAVPERFTDGAGRDAAADAVRRRRVEARSGS